MSKQSTSFGPTCRLASSPVVGPGATNGTLKLGYPLLLYKDAVPTQLSHSRVVRVLCVRLSHDSPQPRATTLGPQQRLTPPHGRVWSRHVSRESDRPKASTVSSNPHGRVPGPWIYSLDLQDWSWISTCASRTPGMGSGPPVWGPGRPQWGPKVLGQNILVPCSGPKQGSSADTCPDLI
jgi:hypothetical protein